MTLGSMWVSKLAIKDLNSSGSLLNFLNLGLGKNSPSYDTGREYKRNGGNPGGSRA